VTAGLLTERLSLPPGRPRRRLGPAATSVLLHALVLAALLVTIKLRPREENWLPPPASVDMVFQGGSKEAPSAPNPTPERKELPPTPSPPALAPSPPVLPTPPTPPVVQVPPAPPTPPAPPVVQTPQASPPVVAPPAPAPSPPQVVQTKPSQPPPPAPTEPMESSIQLVPPPPLQLPALRPPAASHPAIPPRPVAPPRPRPSFPTPMAYSFNGSPRSDPARPLAGRRSGIDLSFAPAGRFSDRLQPQARVDNDQVGEDWLNLVSAWWRRHAYYPPEAGNNGEQGDVTVRVVVRRDGKVESVQLEDRNRSPWLNMASVAVFRNATLPPLPSDVTAESVPMHFTIHYMIIN
jgi:periplasmic protein TonB